MTGRSRKTWFAARPLRSHRGGELEIETGRHRTDESEELRWAPRVVDSEISRNGMLAAGFGDPVLMVRPHAARPPDRSGRTVGKRRPTLGHPLACTVNEARAFTAGSASIHCRTLFGDVQRDPRSTAHGAPLYFRAIVSPLGAWPNRGFRALWSRRRPLYPTPMAAARSRPGARSPALTYMRCGHPAPTTAGSNTGPGSLGHKSCAVFAVSLSYVAGCLQDDAPVWRTSRLRTTSDGARWAH
jgi:hypothetical protein